MIIVGINAYHADASAAIFVDGVLVAAIEEERFTRIKHWAGFPVQSIIFCLKEAGVTWDDVDYFAVGRNPGAKFFKKILYLASHPLNSFQLVKQRYKNRVQVTSIDYSLSKLAGKPSRYFKNKVINVEHHRSHLASAFFASPFESAACLSVDGSGDFSTTMTAVGEGNHLRILDSIDFPHSLGFFYTAFTQYLGFPNYGDEYKVMGMAPYGTPKYTNLLQDLISLTSDGLFKLQLQYFRNPAQGVVTYGSNHVPIVENLFSKQLIEKFGPPRSPEEELSSFHKDLAASVQKMTEDVIFHILDNLQKKTGLDNLCIAGGVAQNSVVNGKITRNTGFKNVYVPSAGHDAGISMGSALFVQHEQLHQKRNATIYSAYTGTYYTNKEIKEILNNNNIIYEEYKDEQLFDVVTDYLLKGAVVGWMSGRSEFGPRALGARSILVDPRRKDAKELLNYKIKRRESFRPFAPSILKEYVADYFELDELSPFMERVLPIRKDKQSEIPAVTHIDGTGRLQTVDALLSPRYYQLIDTFRKKTGIPMLLNTSFNENEPIVNTPVEALNCFLRTNMDVLVMENIFIKRLS